MVLKIDKARHPAKIPMHITILSRKAWSISHPQIFQSDDLALQAISWYLLVTLNAAVVTK